METKNMNNISFTITNISFTTTSNLPKPKAVRVLIQKGDTTFQVITDDPDFSPEYWNLSDLEQEYETLLRMEATSPTGEVREEVDSQEGQKLLEQGWSIALVNDTETARNLRREG